MPEAAVRATVHTCNRTRAASRTDWLDHDHFSPVCSWPVSQKHHLHLLLLLTWHWCIKPVTCLRWWLGYVSCRRMTIPFLHCPNFFTDFYVWIWKNIKTSQEMLGRNSHVEILGWMCMWVGVGTFSYEQTGENEYLERSLFRTSYIIPGLCAKWKYEASVKKLGISRWWLWDVRPRAPGDLLSPRSCLITQVPHDEAGLVSATSQH